MKYTVKDRLEHDGEVHEAGSAIDLDEKAAAPLVAVGVLESPGKNAKGDPAPRQGA